MNITLSCPSKTFFLGEYLALSGEPALLVNTTPRFKLHVIYNNNETHPICRGINPRSPAGKLLEQHPDLLKKYGFEFRDPHVGHGGFGASSAQYLLFYAFNRWLQKQPDEAKHWDLVALLHHYIECSWDGVGYSPSGADLIGQLQGGITYFDKKNQIVEILNWPFIDETFLLIHTGNKVATHQHLRQVQALDTKALLPFVHYAKIALQEKNLDLLSQSIQQFGQQLQAAELVMPNTTILLDELKQHPMICAKGCGALGADVLLVLLKKNDIDSIKIWCEAKGLSIIATSDDISTGVKIHDLGK